MTNPSRMRAAVLKSFESATLVVDDVPIPELQKGEVLVKMAASPINPSDLVFLRNQYGVKKKLPVVPGFEGAGTVVDGRGWLGRLLVGRRVACRAPEKGNGTWAEYMACPATACVPLLPSVSLEQGASLLVNPLTACALVSIAISRNHQVLVQTAAASALGKMTARLAAGVGLRVVHVVRRKEQAETLREAGAEHVLDSSDPAFETNLVGVVSAQKIRLLLDAVGGPVSDKILAAMPAGAQVILYGALSGAPVTVAPAQLIFEQKRVEGFWLTEWIKTVAWPTKLALNYRAQRHLGGALATTVQQRFGLEQVHEAIALYKANRSEGKVLLTPQGA